MLELIFIHIHKTGGKSMSQVFEDVYGKSSTFRLNQNVFRGLKPSEVNLRTLIPARTNVLSGHLPFPYLRQLVVEDKPRLVTWLRDPIERVISNYYWRLNLDRSKAVADEIAYTDMTLDEYIHIPKNQNRMSTFLEGLVLTDLFFIGFLESHDQDMEALAKKLNWGNVPDIHTNINPTFKKVPREVSAEMRLEIERLNALDIALYQEAQSVQSDINQLERS